MRCFFDIFDGDHWARDDIGMDCRDERSARHQAVLALCEMAREQLPGDGPVMGFQVRVRKGELTAFLVRLDFTTEAGPALTDARIAPPASRPN